VKDIQGSDTPQAGDQWREFLDPRYGYVTINDAGDSVIAVAECYKDEEMLETVEILGWVTSSTNYIKIYTTTSERHKGKTGTGFKLCSPTVKTLLHLCNVDIHIQGIEFAGGGNQIAGNYEENGHAIRIESCIFHDNFRGALIDVPRLPSLIIQIWNCVLYNSNENIIDPGYYTTNLHVENCSIYNPGRHGIYGAECYNVVIHRGENLVDACFKSCIGDYNCDGVEVGIDGTAPGSHSLHNKTLSDISWVFTQETPEVRDGTEVDLHIYTDRYSDSVLIGRGIDRSVGAIGFNTDIDGDLRTGLWTIGADQKAYSSSSSSSSSSSLSSSSESSSSSSSTVPEHYLELRDITY
jgi:hypothetical protein